MTDYKILIKGHYVSGRPWSTHLKLTSTHAPDAVLTTAGTAVSDWWTNGTYGMDTLMPTGTILDSVEVLTLNGVGHATNRVGPTVLSLPGTSIDTGLPDVDSPTVSLRTANIGPGEIGHMKLPAPVEGTVSNGELQPTPQGRMGSAARALLAALTADGSTVFIWNPQETIHKPTPFTKSIVVTAKASNIVGTVHKRVSKAVRTYA